MSKLHSKKLFVTLTYFLSFEMRHDSRFCGSVIFYAEFLHTPMAPKAITIIITVVAFYQAIIRW